MIKIISNIASVIFSIGVIYIFLDQTVGRLRSLRSKFVWYGLQVKDFIFLGISIIAFLLVTEGIFF